MACVVPAHNSRIEALAFDIHHRCLASAGEGGAKVWQMDTGGKNCPRLRCIINSIVLIGHLKLLHTLPSEPLIVRGVSFHERGSRLLVCYLESHEVYVSFFIMPSESFLTAFTSLCMKIESWTKEWSQRLVTRMYVSLICHFSLYDGCL